MTALPGLLAISMYDVRRRFLQSIQHGSVSTLAQAIAWVLHIFWSYYLIIKLQWNEFGAAIAISITYFTAYALQEYYVLFLRRSVFEKYSAPLWHSDSFTGWGDYFKLALPTTALNCIEWWAFEIAIIIAGIIGVKELTAQVAIFQVN